MEKDDVTKIGTATVNANLGPTVHKVYVGPLEYLRGEKAFVADNPPHGVIAQFDTTHTGLAFGWWAFRSGEFVMPEEYEALVDRLHKRSGYSLKIAKAKACEKLCTLGKREVPTPRYV